MQLEILGDTQEVYQGDTLVLTLESPSEEIYAIIDKVQFVSKELEKEVEFVKQGDLLFSLTIQKEETKDFLPGIYTFDVEVHIDGEIIVSDSPKIILVKARRNPSSEEVEQ